MNGLKKKEIQKIKKNKKNVVFPFIIFQDNLEENKITVSVPKKVGCACFRNKIRRRIKYFFKTHHINRNSLVIVNNAEKTEYSWALIQSKLMMIIKKNA